MLFVYCVVTEEVCDIKGEKREAYVGSGGCRRTSDRNAFT